MSIFHPDIRTGVAHSAPGDHLEDGVTEKNEGQQDAQQSEIEKQRLANLKASGQLQEGEDPQSQGQTAEEGQKEKSE